MRECPLLSNEKETGNERAMLHVPKFQFRVEVQRWELCCVVALRLCCRPEKVNIMLLEYS